MGTPKADEWRTMATIYFPIALILCWGKEAIDAEGRSRRQLLDLTMCIVQATWLLCKHQTSKTGRAAYLKYMCTYLHNLQNTVENAKLRPNHHFALHLHDFLVLWGPVYSWWCFPFERINGTLQRIATNNIFGKRKSSSLLLSLTPHPGQLEITMATIFARRANFKHWISRYGISREMESFRHVLSGFLEIIGWSDEPTADDETNLELTVETEGERARYRHKGFVFSREQTHVGNSLVAYEKQGRLCYGSIQRIVVLKSREVVLTIRPYCALPSSNIDLFSSYAPHFPAQLVSGENGELEEIPMSAIKCHCARYQISKNSVVMVELSQVSQFYKPGNSAEIGLEIIIFWCY